MIPSPAGRGNRTEDGAYFFAATTIILRVAIP